jgi:hypothetical protein
MIGGEPDLFLLPRQIAVRIQPVVFAPSAAWPVPVDLADKIESALRACFGTLYAVTPYQSVERHEVSQTSNGLESKDHGP